MESYGALLKKTREEKHIDIAAVERDTSISRHYIEALENEDSTVFPGEPYLYGFLHNYAEYLGLDADSVAVLYKNKKLQEAPVPEGLYVKQKPRYVVPLAVTGAIVVVALTAGLLYFFVFSGKVKGTGSTVALSKNPGARQYTLTDKPLEQRIYKGDQIIVPEQKGNVILTVASTLSTLALDTPAGRQFIDLSDEVELDVDGDAATELIVYVSDISSTDPARGAEVKMLLKKAAPATAVLDVSDIPSGDKVPKLQPQNIVFSDNRAYPFTINATFRGACVFRSAVDNAESVENYYTAGEVVSMTPQNAARLWMSNGNAVKIQIIANGQTYNLETGRAGQVVVEDIKWIKDSDGLYKVVIIEVD
jgi:cytoskeletal protein RodZ